MKIDIIVCTVHSKQGTTSDWSLNQHWVACFSNPFTGKSVFYKMFMVRGLIFKLVYFFCMCSNDEILIRGSLYELIDVTAKQKNVH